MREYAREGREIVKMRWWCIKKYKQARSGIEIAAHLRVPRRTVYDWISKYSNCRKEEMANKPNKVENEVDGRTRKFVLMLREKYNWGPGRIGCYIRKMGPDGIQPICHNLIYRILVEEGVNQPIDFIRKTWGERRFERMHSNSLWQVDFKLTDDEWMLTFLDDHSRLIPGADIEHDAANEFALRLFERCTKKYGFPEQVLADQGTQFYCADKEGRERGESEFTRTLR